MKPFKNLEPISKWVLRFSVAAYIISLYVRDVTAFNFGSLSYIVNLIFVLFAAFLLIGGLSKNSTLTIISGFVIMLIAVYKMYITVSHSTHISTAGFSDPSFYCFLMVFGIGLFFVAKGNA